MKGVPPALRPARPFLKWAGGKLRIVERIRETLPAGARLVEPFVGSGAVFLNTDYPEYILADRNGDLIQLYRVLKEGGAGFIGTCRALFTADNNDRDAYYRLRDEFNACTDPERRAALFLYLNRHGYNGLCRYNRKGAFNVPFGRYKRPYFPEREMHAFRDKAAHARFVETDFESVMAAAADGDVIYCDPPYVPLSESANFTAYSTGGFSPEDQRRLARAAEQTAARGVPVAISNHDTEAIRSVYQAGRAAIAAFPVRRFISCNGGRRDPADELLALFTPVDDRRSTPNKKSQRARPVKTEDLVYSAPSPIHGTGLFAKVRIKKGTHIGTYQGPQAKRDGKYVLWVDEGDGWVGRRGQNVLRYTNHSDKPNAEFDGFDLYARRGIAPNEEITFNYEGDEQG